MKSARKDQYKVKEHKNSSKKSNKNLNTWTTKRSTAQTLKKHYITLLNSHFLKSPTATSMMEWIATWTCTNLPIMSIRSTKLGDHVLTSTTRLQSKHPWKNSDKSSLTKASKYGFSVETGTIRYLSQTQFTIWICWKERKSETKNHGLLDKRMQVSIKFMTPSHSSHSKVQDIGYHISREKRLIKCSTILSTINPLILLSIWSHSNRLNERVDQR